MRQLKLTVKIIVITMTLHCISSKKEEKEAAAATVIWAQESIWRVAMMALELAALAGLIRPS